MVRKEPDPGATLTGLDFGSDTPCVTFSQPFTPLCLGFLTYKIEIIIISVW